MRGNLHARHNLAALGVMKYLTPTRFSLSLFLNPIDLPPKVSLRQVRIPQTDTSPPQKRYPPSPGDMDEKKPTTYQDIELAESKDELDSAKKDYERRRALTQTFVFLEVATMLCACLIYFGAKYPRES
jgi:hypothetical protein